MGATLSVVKKKSGRLLLIAALLLFVVAPCAQMWRTWREVQQRQQERALIAAIQRGDSAGVEALLDQGADANARKTLPDNRSPWEMLRARVLHQPEPSLVVDEVDYSVGRSALWIATDAENIETVHPYLAEARPIVLALLRHGASVHVAGYSGVTPLMNAAANLDRDCILALIAKGANVYERDESGRSALFHATENRNHAAVSTLLEYGADANTANYFGHTPLLQVAMDDPGEDNTALVKLLLAHGANPNRKSDDGDTPLSWAVSKKKTDVIRLLKAAGARK